ncbi:MAG TPA: OB-fold domain-containing protein [Acidimicrobiales bacterium]|jgi:uncharacterized OB-fold protein|nr:OB-fold domain-containing protein [Acidimicrobiales bacterium]
MIEGLILPDVDDAEAAMFWAGCAGGELRVQACATCGRRRMPPRTMCPWCGSFDARWNVMSGRGRVWSVVVPHPPLLPAYGDQAPYNVVIVTLDDDPSIRFVGNVVAEAGAPLNSIDPHTVDIGDAVEAVFSQVADDVWLPQWRPVT